MKIVKDIEVHDDGYVIIETVENGIDCFYAFFAQDGDFKGTWLLDGSLKRESIR